YWLTPDDLIKLAAFDEFHAEVTRTIALTDFVNRNDLRMLQARGRFRFVPETFKMWRARPVAETDHFQRDRSIQAFLPGSVNHALSAASDLLQQLIVAKLRHG